MRAVTIGFVGLLACFLFLAVIPVNAENPGAPDRTIHSLAAPSPQGTSGDKTVLPADTAGTEGMTDIIDIKPLEDVGFDTRIIRYSLLAVLGVLLILLVFFLIDRLLRKRKKKPGDMERVIPPDILALQRLAELESLKNHGEKEFYFRLTAIVRDYIKGRFALDAPEMTTEELLPVIPALPVDRNLTSALKELLRSTDPVKFAGVPVTPDKMEKDMAFARQFVETTMNVPEDSENNPGD